jgi:molybdate transport system substrate-binding protein
VVSHQAHDHDRDGYFSLGKEWTMKTLTTFTGTSLITRLAASSALVMALLAAGDRAGAAEIRILSAAVMKTVFDQTVDGFERASGHRLIISYGTMGAINQRILDGETADLTIGSTASMAGLVQKGKISSESSLTIAKVGVGVVVPAGTPKPRMGSIEDFKRALLAAKTVVYADPAGGGAAGIHVGRVIEKLGISEQVKPKTKFGAGGDVTEVTLAQGEGTLGVTQISEIVDKPGAEFVGPLPDELQNYTGITAGSPTGAKQPEAVAAFMAFLKSPTTAAAMKAKGMQTD